MYRQMFKVSLVSAVLLLAACSSTEEEADLDLESTKPVVKQPAPEKSGETTTEVSDKADLVIIPEWGDDSNAWNTGYSIDYLRSLGIDRDPLDYDTIYFPYNSSQLGERAKVIAEAHSRNLQTYAGSPNVVLEGHSDERGTREYNLALGERRGQAVRDLMTSYGTGTSGLQVVSYGEERPVILEQNEDAWRANRRVQILY